MWQQLIVVGNVGRDPEFQYTPQGIAVCNFSVAVNKVTGRGEDRKEKTTWVRVTCWRERAETASQYVKKGMSIMVIGEVSVHAYMAKDGSPAAALEMVANDFKFLSRVQSDESEQRAPAAANGEPPDDEIDIPF